jgi:lipopolysaccharide assembly outer membrane protein LptD (OstA)
VTEAVGKVLRFAVFAGAQVAPTERIEVTADSVTEAGSVVQLRGNVQIRRSASLVTADEADLTAAPVRLELRGNVRLTSED